MPVTPQRVGGVFYSALMFLVVSVLSGVLIAGLAVPFALMAGLSSKAALDEMESLPVELETPPQAERTTVLLGDGSVLTNLYDENRVYVSLDKIAPIMRTAQLAIEDHRFYEHGAMDPIGTMRAFVRNQSGGTGSGGGSTLTQQYVKMVQIETAYLNNDKVGVRKAQEATIARKVTEMRYAIALEQKLTKDQILERYLNIAYFGNGTYGVEAAAHYYFDTTADKLTLDQAALLAGTVQNPDQVNPISNEAASLERRNNVLNRMAELNLISKDDAAKAKEVKFDRSKVRSTQRGCEASEYPFLCDYVIRSLLDMPSLGATPAERRALLYRGGLTIKTKIDPKTQDAAQDAISKVVAPTDQVIATVNIIEPGTGLILASAQSRPVMGTDTSKGETYYNYSMTPKFGGAEGFQSGSTFKAFTLAAALDQGVPMTQKYKAPFKLDMSDVRFQSCNAGRIKPGGKWEPQNLSTSISNAAGMDMKYATMKSVNTYFVQLEQRAGLCNTVKMAAAAGIDFSNGDVDYWSTIPSFTLGVPEIAPLSLAEAYATFAARGLHCDPHIVESVASKSGKKFDVPTGNCQQVMRPEVADGVNQLLEAVMGPNGSGAIARIPGNYPQAGKTGTTEENQAVAFAGYTPEVAGAAIIAADKTAPDFKKDSNGKSKRNGIKGMRLKTGFELIGTGGGDAGLKIYTPAMTAALKGRPKTNFVDPPKTITEPKQVPVPSVSGLSPAQAEQLLTEQGFAVLTQNVYNNAPKGTYLGINPKAGTMVPEGSEVYLLFSDGPAPAAPPSTPPPPTDTAPPGTPPSGPSTPPQPPGGPTTKPGKPGRPGR